MVEGRVLLRFASAYGFRNIQTLTRKLKTPKVSGKHELAQSVFIGIDFTCSYVCWLTQGKAAYHYVEVSMFHRSVYKL